MGKKKRHHSSARWLSISDLRGRAKRKLRKKKRATPSRVTYRKRAKLQRSLIQRYYRPLQKLLLLRGYKVSLVKLQKVPLKRALEYIRTNFSRELIARYMPLSRVFPASGRKLDAATTAMVNHSPAPPEPTNVTTVRKVIHKVPRRRDRKTVHVKIRKNARSAKEKKRLREAVDAMTTPPPLQPLEIVTPVSQTPTVLHSPFLDINQPPPLTEEISSGSEETRRVNSIFTFADNHPFDPGLWTMVMSNLPQGYTIPDTNFTKRLERAQSEVVDAYLTGRVEPLTPDSV